MKSMTGFGTTQFQVKGVSTQVTVRTVNGRYLEVRTHLPRELQNLEVELKALAKKHFNRGTVDISVQFSGGESLNEYHVELDHSVAKDWMTQVKKLKSSMKLSGEFGLEALVQLPGVIKTTKSSRIEAGSKSLLQGSERAFKQCDVFRKKEGTALKKALLKLLSDLDGFCQKIGKKQRSMESEVSQKLKADMKHEMTVEGRNVLEAKASDVLERMNIEEELSRLSQHIKAVKKLMSELGSIGKKLDFFAQEFLREMNTIGSKSGSSETTQFVVEGKSLIESFREQVQNIE